MDLRTSTVPDLLRWVVGKRRRYRVEGESMTPTLDSGATVLVDPRAFARRPPSPGDVVVLRHPLVKSRTIIKRVSHLGSDGQVAVVGDNPKESTDSRSFGLVPPERLIGLVVSRFP